MAIFFQGDIRKAPHDITNERLKALLEQEEPKAVRFFSAFVAEAVQRYRLSRVAGDGTFRRD